MIFIKNFKDLNGFGGFGKVFKVSFKPYKVVFMNGRRKFIKTKGILYVKVNFGVGRKGKMIVFQQFFLLDF